MNSIRSSSLRSRFLWPIATLSILVVVGVMALSYWFAEWRSESEQSRRFEGIASILADASFPLTPSVLDTVSSLTGAELITVDAGGRVIHHTMLRPQAVGEPPPQVARVGQIPDGAVATIGHTAYRKRSLQRSRPTGRSSESQSPESQVIVLFDESERVARRRGYALLPLGTGVTTTLLLSVFAFTMSGRLIHRIQLLKDRVARIAGGDFAPRGVEETNDEIGQLAQSVEQMGRDLNGLWAAVNQGQRERLIHQLGAGLAHQLRNSLTGAKMAVELHRRRCPGGQEEDLDVALRELDRLEADVRRILQLGRNELESPQPECVKPCIEDAIAGAAPIAKHLHVALQHRYDEEAEQQSVASGEALRNAMSNLVVNAIQAGGDQVEVRIGWKDNELQVEVWDNGPGPPTAIEHELFEPFVTSKPEGLGLGLAVVKRCAETLHGAVSWERQGERTKFVLRVPGVRPANPQRMHSPDFQDSDDSN